MNTVIKFLKLTLVDLQNQIIYRENCIEDYKHSGKPKIYLKNHKEALKKDKEFESELIEFLNKNPH